MQEQINKNAPAIVNETNISTVNVEQALEEWNAYQKLCKSLLNDSDYQEYTTIDKKTGKQIEKRFPKKSAWVKLGRAFNVNTEIVDKEFVLTKTGETREAYYCIRATLPNGRTVESDGSCSRHENGKSNATSHTIRSTAKTRATNRAISELIGAGEVSAEEIQGEIAFQSKQIAKNKLNKKQPEKPEKEEVIEAEVMNAKNEFTTADNITSLDENPVVVTYAKNVAKEVKHRNLSINQRNMKLKARGMLKRGEIPSEYEDELISFIEQNCPGDDD